VVDADKQLGAEKVKAGDLIIAMPASGFHANGYSLIRHILKTKKLDVSKKYDGLDSTLGEALLTPTEIYALDCLALIKAQGEKLRTFSHITGGGLADNTARVIPAGLTAKYDRSTWSLPAAMKFLADVASVPQEDMERTWNCGIGMSAVVDPTVADLVIRSLAARGMKAWIAGVVEPSGDKQAPRSYLVSEYGG
jgi:phosphoribosylformylglycinamidine cyclo-ligase